MAKSQETETVKAVEPEIPVETQLANRRMHINVRRPFGSKEDSLLVGHNGKFYQIRYNEDVYVPEVVYYHIKEKLRAERVRDAHIERLAN